MSRLHSAMSNFASDIRAALAALTRNVGALGPGFREKADFEGLGMLPPRQAPDPRNLERALCPQASQRPLTSGRSSAHQNRRMEASRAQCVVEAVCDGLGLCGALPRGQLGAIGESPGSGLSWPVAAVVRNFAGIWGAQDSEPGAMFQRLTWRGRERPRAELGLPRATGQATSRPELRALRAPLVGRSGGPSPGALKSKRPRRS